MYLVILLVATITFVTDLIETFTDYKSVASVISILSLGLFFETVYFYYKSAVIKVNLKLEIADSYSSLKFIIISKW